MNTTDTNQPFSLADTKRLIDELVAAYDELLTCPSPYARDRAREAISIYNFKVLPDIEGRLDTCHRLLRKGLRSEALDYASEEPDLVEVANAVDIERYGRDKCAQWAIVTRAEGLASPKMPDFDKVSSLVEARENLRSLTPLIEKWKHQNLKRDPIHKRIKTLRRLHERDQTNAIWHTMLAEHEQHLVTELTRDANKLVTSAKNIRGEAGELLEEHATRLSAGLQIKWTTLIPPLDVISSLNALVDKIKRRRIDDRLDAISADLVTQFSHLESHRATAQVHLQSLSNDWHSAVAERVGIESDDPRLARIASILSYTKDLTDYRAAINELHHLAETPSASLKHRIAILTDMQSLLQKVDSIASRLPDADKSSESHEAAYRTIRTVQRTIDKERGFRRLSIAFLSISAAAAIAIAVFYSASVLKYENAATAAVEIVENFVSAVEKGEEREIDSLLASLPEDVSSHPRVLDALSLATSRAEFHADRRDALRSTLTTAQEHLATAQDAIPDDPLSQWPEMFEHAARAHLEIDSRELAITEQETRLASNFGQDIEAFAAMLRSRADTAFQGMARNIELTLSGITLNWPEDLEEATEQISAAKRQLQQLQSIASTLSSPSAPAPWSSHRMISDTTASLVAPTSRLAQSIDDLASQRDALAALARQEDEADNLLASGQLSSYADKIISMTKNLKASPLATDYTLAASHLSNWEANQLWQSYLESLPAPAELTSTTAKPLADTLNMLLSARTRLTAASDAATWLPAAFSIAQRNDVHTHTLLTEQLTSVLKSDFGMGIDSLILPKDGSYPRYYCLKKDTPQNNEIENGFFYVIDWPDNAGEWERKRDFGRQANSPANKRSTFHLIDCPQKVLAELGLAFLDSNRDPKLLQGTPESLAVAFLAVVCDTTAKPELESIDPLAHCLLLRWLLSTSLDVLPDLKNAFPRSAQAIDAGNNSNNNLIILKGVENDSFRALLNPDEQNSKAFVLTDRRTCIEFINTVTKEAAITAEKLARQRDFLEQRYRGLQRFVLVGRLAKSNDTKVRVANTSGIDLKNRDIYTLTGSATALRLTKLTTCDDSGDIPAGANINQPAGELVYVQEED